MQTLLSHVNMPVSRTVTSGSSGHEGVGQHDVADEARCVVLQQPVHIASAPSADQVVQQGQVLVTQCVPSPASDTIPHVTVRGQYFKPEESIQIEADYTRADCTIIFLTGQTRADADGTFTVDLAPDPQLNAPPAP